MPAVLADAARVKPPSAGNTNETVAVAGVASVAEDLFALEGDDVMHMWISVSATAAFNFLAGVVGMADPTNKAYFGTGAAVQFRVTRAKLPKMIVIIPAGGDFTWWNSGP